MATVADSLDSEIKDPQLRAEVEAYANGPRHTRASAETVETLCRLREDNAAGASHFKFAKQDELTRERLGRVLSAKAFLAMLSRVTPARYTGQARHGLLRLEVLVPTASGGEWKFICGAQPGLVPEYSTMYTDRHGVTTSEMYRGWRTVLLRLILDGAITEEAAHKVFGRPGGPEARRYLATLFEFRNRR